MTSSAPIAAIERDETLAEEFARLTNEYHTGDEHTKPEAWNLLADFAVENAAPISAALSALVEEQQVKDEQTQQGWGGATPSIEEGLRIQMAILHRERDALEAVIADKDMEICRLSALVAEAQNDAK